MNILPKKRWHVRTKENIARVRKDEAEAAEKEKEERLRIENADREARLSILKHKSKQKLLESGISDTKQQEEEVTGHINLFTDLDHAVKRTNKDHDNEIKEKKEEFEKKIGYLTYLGQDTNEALKKKNWYEVPPSSRISQSSSIKDTYEKLVLKDQDGKPKKKELDVKDGEIDWKAKQHHDPINNFKKYCTNQVKTSMESKECNGKEIKHTSNNKINKSKKKCKNDKELKLKLLREARIKREQQEKYRTELFLSGLNNKTPASTNTETSSNKVKAKYNSQFNPELARQNYR
ncbi:leukocyte receptor cluster member 1 homolog [Ostrinia furnacalis]|uniref:leukocyte receptor cluster member 1 homolog n=1 Tax=Ostrinia furnacalis TaxID=93504 RepID=UPI00103FC0E8|nr:leukocyte receptor cluster member 1 homolog [Ostrinia furnacalis]